MTKVYSSKYNSMYTLHSFVGDIDPKMVNFNIVEAVHNGVQAKPIVFVIGDEGGTIITGTDAIGISEVTFEHIHNNGANTHVIIVNLPYNTPNDRRNYKYIYYNVCKSFGYHSKHSMDHVNNARLDNVVRMIVNDVKAFDYRDIGVKLREKEVYKLAIGNAFDNEATEIRINREPCTKGCSDKAYGVNYLNVKFTIRSVKPLALDMGI